MNHVIGKIGHQYDNQNIIDLALMVIPGIINPFKKHTIRACFGTYYQSDRCNLIQNRHLEIAKPSIRKSYCRNEKYYFDLDAIYHRIKV
jgi:hypothetical protein